MNRTQMETVRATAHRKEADQLQDVADGLRHWNPFPRNVEQRREQELKRIAWQQAEAEARGARAQQNFAAYVAATRLLKDAKKGRMR